MSTRSSVDKRLPCLLRWEEGIPAASEAPDDARILLAMDLGGDFGLTMFTAWNENTDPTCPCIECREDGLDVPHQHVAPYWKDATGLIDAAHYSTRLYPPEWVREVLDG